MLVTAFLSGSKSFNFMAAVIVHSDFGAQEIKSVTVSIVSPSICHEVLGRVLYKWKSAIDWRLVFPTNSHAEILTSKVMVFADWASGMY